MKLKKHDKRLLFEFCRDSRMPFSALAKKTRMSQQLIAYKIKSMQESGVISFSYPLVDYSRFGLLRFFVHFRVNYKSKQTFRNIIEKLQKNEDVVEVIEREGHYDLIVAFSTSNPSSFNKTLRQIIEDNSDQLKNHMILTSVVSHYFPKKYLLGIRASTEDIIIGGDRESLPITDNEKNVLEQLRNNARARVVDIASGAKIGSRTAISTMKKLTNTDILKGTSSIINLREIGFKKGMMLIKYHNLSLEAENNLRVFCISHRNITEMHKVFGNYDVAIMIETENAVQLREVFIQIREMFEDIINDSDSFQIFQTHKRTLLPQAFFSELE